MSPLNGNQHEINSNTNLNTSRPALTHENIKKLAANQMDYNILLKLVAVFFTYLMFVRKIYYQKALM